MPEFIYKGLKEYSSNANAYHPQPKELIEKLANKHQIPKEWIYLTAGIDEAIQMFLLTYGKQTYVFTPAYIVYKDTEIFGGKLNPIYSVKNNEFQISIDKIKQATLIFLANPNNPSGFTSKIKVIDLINNNKHCVVVIDEAYGSFGNLSVVDQVKHYKNLAVFRSFSKDYGMAGNRIGYMIAQPQIINKVKDKAQWSNVSYLSVGAAMTALDNEVYFKKIREEIKIRREDFRNFLIKHGLIVLPSLINALLIKFKTEKEGTKFVNYLKLHNIIISHGNGNSNIGLDKSFVRIVVGTTGQIGILKNIIKKYK